MVSLSKKLVLREQIYILKTVMNKNRHELLLYKSQAQKSNHNQHSAKLYGSGATVTSLGKNPLKLLEAQPVIIRRDIQTERVIDNLSSRSRLSPTYSRINFLARSKSGENVKWQSPTKQTMFRQNFRSIIQQINQQNDRNFSQLDQDLKRIKTNLNRIQIEKEKQIQKEGQKNTQAKQSSQCQALTEQIDIMQQENERLIEKNTLLADQKRKMALQIQQYQAFIQREKSKKTTLMTSRQPTNDSKVQDLINNNKKLKQQLEKKEAQYQKLESQNNQLSNAKLLAQKIQKILSEQKNKLLSKISEIQKEKDSLKLKLQQQLRTQLEKKDAYYVRIIKNQQLKYEQTILKLKASMMKSVQIKQEELNDVGNREIQRLTAQIVKLKNSEKQLKYVQEQSFKQFEELNSKIDALKNQIEIINFSYNQSIEQLNQKDNIINELNKKYQTSSKQIKRQSKQVLGIKQRLEQQNKKCYFLQQLCNKLQRQLQQMHYEFQIKETNLNQEISDHEKELKRLKRVNQSIKQQNNDLQNQICELSHQNQKNSIELKRKVQENITIKKQNLMMLSDRNSPRLRNAYSPQKNEGETEFQIAQQRVHRLHSARESRDQDQLSTIRQRQHAKMKKIQKQLNELVIQCRTENQRTKKIYKQKKTKMKETLNHQSQKIQQLNRKIQKLENQIQLKKIQASQRQENNRQIIRKKQAQILLFERKQAQNKQKMSTNQSQNIQLKKKIQKLESIKYQDKSLSLQKKLQTFRSDYSQLLDTILKEITSIIENNISDSTNIKPKDFHIGSKQIKSHEQLHMIAQINYYLHSLKQTFRSLNKKINQSNQNTRISQNNQNSYIIDKSLLVLEKIQQQPTMVPKKNQTASKYLEQQYQKVQLKYSDLQKKYQRIVIDEKRKSKQLQELNEQLRFQKKELNRLKNQSEIIQDQKQDLRIKLKYCQDRLSKIQAQTLQHISDEFSCITPNKEIAFYRQSTIQVQKQIQQAKSRSRIKSLRSCDKRQNDIPQMKIYDKKMSQYQSKIGKLNRMLESKTEQIEYIQKQIAELKQKQIKFQKKYQKKCLDYERLQEKYELIHKNKRKLQSRINDLENEQKVLINDLEKIQMQYQQSIDTFSQKKQQIQRQNKQLVIQRQQILKKLKRDFGEKEEKYNSLIQEYQLKIIDITSQCNKLKQTINSLTAKNESNSQRCNNLHQELNRKEQKIYENELKMTQLRQRLQKQSKQKDSMLTVFSNSTSRFSKVLQEKQFQIQQLKFIQQSTIINLQYARSQQNRKKTNDSTYSFKNQF